MNELKFEILVDNFRKTVEQINHYNCQLDGSRNEWAVRYWEGSRDCALSLIEHMEGKEYDTQSAIDRFCK